MKQTFGSIARERLATAMHSTLESNGKATLHLPFRQDIELLRICLDQSAELRAEAQRFEAHEGLYMSSIVQLDVPGLANLDPKDIVSIRQGADEFDRWRADLRLALRDAQSIPMGIERAREFRRAIEDRMRESLDRLEASISQSSTLAAATAGKTAFVSGVLAASVPAAIGTAGALNWAVVLGLLLGGAYSAAQSYSPASRGRLARQAHYVALRG